MTHEKLSDRELKLLLAVLRCGENAYAPKICEKLGEYVGERPETPKPPSVT